MKINVNELRTGDKLMFPNGDVWEVGHRSRHGFIIQGTQDGWISDCQFRSILSAVEVERKPEKVEFTVKVNDYPKGSLPYIYSDALEPFSGQTVKVEVTPE